MAKKQINTKKSAKSTTFVKKIQLNYKKRPAIFLIIAVLLLSIVGYSGLSAYRVINSQASTTTNYWTPVRYNNVTMKVCVFVSSSNTPRVRVKAYNPTPQVRWAQLIVNKEGPGQHEYQPIELANFNRVIEYPDRSGRNPSLPGGDPRTFYFKVNIGTDTVTKGINYGDINKCDARPSVPNGERWDRVAQCESRGNWEANTGNGFYGGLQFYLPTWQSYGGTGRPDENSREEQIRVAERVRIARGSVTADWGDCGRLW